VKNEHERLVHGPSTYVQKERRFCDDAVFVQARLETPIELARVRCGSSAKRVAKRAYVAEVKVPDKGQPRRSS
jgi:hypothetical protein